MLGIGDIMNAMVLLTYGCHTAAYKLYSQTGQGAVLIN